MFKFARSSGIFAIGIIIGTSFSALIALAWTGPTAAPPSANVAAPLNTSSTAQSKAGGLLLNTGGATNGLIVQNGRVGFGVTSPAAKLQVSDGDTSYALFGPNASWGGSLNIGAGPASISSGKASVISSNGNLHLDAGTGQNMYLAHYTATNTFLNANGGNVGIGMTSPGARLVVGGSSGYANNGYYDIGAGRIAANESIYSYGRVCVGNNYGNCMGTGGTVIRSDGVQFPDGTLQTTASAGRAGCAAASLITCDVNYWVVYTGANRATVPASRDMEMQSTYSGAPYCDYQYGYRLYQCKNGSWVEVMNSCHIDACNYGPGAGSA